MTPTFHRRAASERGTVFVHVAIALFALFGILVYVFDLGIVWVSRGQAQNAADAGALSGALARAFDDFDDPPVADGVADISGRLAALANNVWGAAPGVNMSWGCPTGVVGKCARADVYRNGEFASASLPLIFGSVLGITSHGVRATATAVATYANSTKCMRPFSVADRWLEAPDMGTDPDVYNHWDPDGDGTVELDPHDTYSAGTAWKIPEDIGVQQILKNGPNPQSDQEVIIPGWSMPVRLPDGMGGYLNGGDDYREAISTCIGAKVSIGQYLPLEMGEMVGPTNQGVDDLIDRDPDAFFNTTTKMVEGSCAPGVCPIVGKVTESPRIVPIAVWDVDDFNRRQASGEWGDCPEGPRCVKVVKILGYFVSGFSGGDVIGYLMTAPGDWDPGAGDPPGDDFLINIRLVR